MNESLRQFRDFIVSLKLTVVLLTLGMVLVFLSTLDQVHLGIWGIQEKWYRSFVVMHDTGGTRLPIFPGGYAIGGLLLINLIAAHIYRFKFTLKKAGIQLVHIGVILLLIGELLSGLWQEDYAMRLKQGQTKNYSESHRDNELAIIDTTDPKFDEVVAIPEEILAKKEAVQNAKLPFRAVVKEYFPNAGIQMRDADKSTGVQATQGLGLTVTATPQPITYKQDERNMPAAYVELVGRDGPIGTWLVTTAAGAEHSPPFLRTPQTFTHDGHTYTIALRFTRAYKPFTLTLLKFSHDRYAGTELPKNFSSRLKLTTSDGQDDREVLIYMNNPLRYSGLTFYQSGYEGEDTTILQVVRNPSWQLPYIACSLMTLGLLWQFAIHLNSFFRKRALKTAAK
jgi:hypothetical protein